MKTKSFIYTKIACLLMFFVILSLSLKFAPDAAAMAFIHPLNIYLNPTPTKSLTYGDYIYVIFDYYADERVRIFVRPFTNGAKTLGYRAISSPILPSTNGNFISSNTWFTIIDKYGYEYVCIDQLRFQIFSADTPGELLSEFFLAVDDYCYSNPSYSDGFESDYGEQPAAL